MIIVELLRRDVAAVIVRPRWWQIFRRESERLAERRPVADGSRAWLYTDGSPVEPAVCVELERQVIRVAWQRVTQATAPPH